MKAARSPFGTRGAKTGRRQRLAPTMLIVLALAVAPVFAATAAAAEEQGQKRPTPVIDEQLSVFLIPNLFRLPATALRLYTTGKFDQAQKALEKMVVQFPLVPRPRSDPVAARIRENVARLSLNRLAGIVERNFRAVSKIPQARYLKARRQHKRFAALVAEASAAILRSGLSPPAIVRPRLVSDGKAVIDELNTYWMPRLNTLRSVFRFETSAAPLPVQGGKSRVAQQLNDWYARDLAAGNSGDLYDNRDDRHSPLPRSAFPQFTHVEYGPQARMANIHYGLNDKLFYNTITLGNSSTAVTGGILWRSLPRLALTRPDNAKLLALQYLNNQLYVYPSNDDHSRKHGDLMPANTPYMIVSQGASGSDRPFLDAVAAILAAFRPEVKKHLRENHLVMATVQMIFRRGQNSVKNDADYLSAKAHPSVFAASGLNVMKMIKLANSLEIKDIPATVSLSLVEESGPRKGIDQALDGLPERLFDTPGAIARVVRLSAHEKRMVVRARASSTEPDIRFRWVILRGDRKRIQIKPRNPSGSEVELIVSWHERGRVPGRDDLTSDRVDIAAFADNGGHLSAPAFVTLLYPAHQKRTYNERRQIVRIDHQDPVHSRRYRDPALFPARDWNDSFIYDKGRLIGWSRRRGAKEVRYTRHGARVVETDDAGRPLKAEVVDYAIKHTADQRMSVNVQATGRFLHYLYDGAEDRFGKLRDP